MSKLYFFYNAIFYLIVFVICRYFFKQIASADPIKVDGHDEKYFKHDVWIAAILYLLCTMLWFYPCLGSLSSHLIGPAEDNMQHLWNIWWFHKAIVDHAGSLAYSKYIFYPEGSSLLFNSFSFYNLFLSIPLGFLFNPTLIYNLLILHTFLLSGIGAFLLIRYLTKDSYVSLLGGFIFAFNPSHFAHAPHHLELSSIQFIPLFILFFIKALRGSSKKDLFLASFFFFLNSFCNWNYMIFGLFFIGTSYIYLAIRRKNIILKDILIKSSVIVGATFVILSPWLLRMVILSMKYPGQGIEGGHDYYVADLYALFTPDPYHWLAQWTPIKLLNTLFTGNNDWEKTVYLGLVNIVIVLITFKHIVQKTAKYFLGLIAGLIMAMGASIHVLGFRIFITLPYTIIKSLPLISNARCPARYIVYVYLFLAIIISFAFKHLFDRYGKSNRNKCLLVLLIALIFFDYFSVCNVTTKAYLPPCYSVIKKENKQFGILDLSPYPDPATYMMYQTYHEIPIVQGYLSRKIGKTLIDHLGYKDLQKQKAQLIESHIKYIVIHKFRLVVIGFDQIQLKINDYEDQYKKIYEDADSIVLQVY